MKKTASGARCENGSAASTLAEICLICLAARERGAGHLPRHSLDSSAKIRSTIIFQDFDPDQVTGRGIL
jgi:hypothetical protein